MYRWQHNTVYMGRGRRIEVYFGFDCYHLCAYKTFWVVRLLSGGKACLTKITIYCHEYVHNATFRLYIYI